MGDESFCQRGVIFHIIMQRQYLIPIITSAALALLSITSVTRAENVTEGHPVAPFTPQIKSGDYVWLPEVSPAGPVVIVVDLPEQVLYVYRNGVRIGRSSISSGKARHHTPTGVFTILQKNIKHTSTIFKNASMPYMERLTWGGVAIHAGNLPGYPASHGCVRMPLDFAQKLYTVTSDGTTVVITDGKSATGSTSTPGLLFATKPDAASTPGGIVWKPERAATGPVSIIISIAESTAYVYRNGTEIGHAPVGGLQAFTGSYVYSAMASVDTEGRHTWLSVASVGGDAPDIKHLVKRVRVDKQFLANARSLIKPGTTLILTDAPVNASTRSDPDFNILTAAAMTKKQAGHE